MRGRQPGADDVDICAVVKPCASMIDSVRPYSRRVSVKNVRVAVVPVGNLRSDIMVVQPAQDGHCQRLTDRLSGAGKRRVLLQG